MSGYIGSTPVPQATQHRESFTCTEGQTTFNTAGYTAQFVDVYLNGSHLSPADFTATNGSDVVLGVAASADDVCDIISYTPFEVAAQTFTGTTTMTDVVAASLDISGNIDVDGTTNLDNTDIDGTLNASGLSYVNSGNGSGVALKIGGEGGGGLKTQYILASGHTNYQIGVATHAASVFSITPSTSAGNTTFTNSALNITSAGLIGIGVTAPASKLDVLSGTANTQVASFSGADNGRGLKILTASTTRDDDTVILKASDAFGEIAFVSDSTEVMRITDANVVNFHGIAGRATGSTGHASISEQSNNRSYLELATTTTDSMELIAFLNSNNKIGTISVSGSATAFNTSSDYRLKENVVYDWDATTRLKQLKPARFNFITEADRIVDGFLAHEAQAVVPEAVHGTHNEVDDDGAAVMQGIDQSKLVPLLVKTIQELEARITALEDV
jgi:hypothetical protein